MLTAGTRLGPYEILSPLGAGGMGEVYKARDTRLNRTVALKVLPSAFAHDPELRERFEREAQAIAGLRHPNICVLHDIGHQEGVEFLVLEHLEGETIEHRLKKGAMPLDRVLQHAIEIADALASAHRAGITHRDLKPGNVMLTKDGAKLLDFGLAKFGVPGAFVAPATSLPTTPRTLTAEGSIVGTFQYMAPEQLEGKDADARTDLFAFGVLIYEMVTGRKAFTGTSRSSLMASILRDDPPAMTTIQPVVPKALDLVVRTCVEKDPDTRFQSAHDVALQLRWIRDGTFQPVPHATDRPGGHRRLAWLGTIAATAAAVAGLIAYSLGQRSAGGTQPELRQLTFRRGFIHNARFAPDGQTVVYTAAWDGKPKQLLSMRVDTGESLPLPVPEGVVMSISRGGELALLTKTLTRGLTAGRTGMLARVPLGGGGVREVLDQVLWADWAPDGKSLAVLRQDRPGHQWLEYPAGTTVYRWSEGNAFNLRVSPDGTLVAVVEQDSTGGGWLTIVDRSGNARRMSRRWGGVSDGMAWSRSGDEVWFSASEVGLNFNIHGVSRDGRERLVHRNVGSVRIADVAADGRAIVLHDRIRAGMVALAPGEATERDLSWLDFSRPSGLSADGRTIVFNESGAGAGPTPIAFVRGTDGSPAIRLAEGAAGALSPDGTSVLIVEARTSLKLVPIGAGETRRLETGNLVSIGQLAAWTPDGARVLFVANEPGRPRRIFVEPVTGGRPLPITPEDVGPGGDVVVSPDSRYVLGRDAQSKVWRYPIDGGTPLPLDGVAAGDVLLRWSGDGQSIWLLGRDRFPVQIFRLDIATGRRSLWREITNADPAGLDPDILRVLIAADGRSYVYGFTRWLSDLYLADGLK